MHWSVVVAGIEPMAPKAQSSGLTSVSTAEHSNATIKSQQLSV